jgi:hypothetical protein
MYWYSPKLKIVIALTGGIMLLQTACKPDIKEKSKYFDIRGFFMADTARLNKLNLQVLKTVTHNGASESKNVHIDNWGRELDLFIGSDINKPAWKDSYKVIDEGGLLVYRAKYPELTVREILIKQDKGKVKWILIFNKTKNILYQSTEKLSYYPDSLYLIEKDQKVRLMGNNHYRIEGVIKK